VASNNDSQLVHITTARASLLAVVLGMEDLETQARLTRGAAPDRGSSAFGSDAMAAFWPRPVSAGVSWSAGARIGRRLP
jgi:hypothetical protein